MTVECPFAPAERREERLADRYNAYRAKVVGSVRADHQFRVERVVINKGATVVLRGRIGPEAVSHLETLIDGLIALDPERLVVDLSAIVDISFGALEALDRRRQQGKAVLVVLQSSTRDCDDRLAPLGS